jgi:hypothetical protein
VYNEGVDVRIWPRGDSAETDFYDVYGNYVTVSRGDRWFTLDGQAGNPGNMYFNDSTEPFQEWNYGEDVWLELWNGPTGVPNYDLEPIVGIEYYRSFVAYNSIGAGHVNWWESNVNAFVSTKDSSVGFDGVYSVFWKYINLDKAPHSASIDLHLFGVVSSIMYVNGTVYNPDVDPDGSTLVSLLKKGRNQLYLSTANRQNVHLLEEAVHYSSGYERIGTDMKFDMKMFVDGNPVVTRGDQTVVDPRAVWHGAAWSEFVNQRRQGTLYAWLGHLPKPDKNTDRYPDGTEVWGLFETNPDYGVPQDSDGDGLIANYEFLIGTNPRDVDTDNDAVRDSDEDYDGDSLLNGEEQRYDTDPRLPDTDDDGVNDAAELALGADPANSLDPYYDRAMYFPGTATDFVRLPIENRFAMANWTIEAWVQPTNDWQGGGTIVRRSVGSAGGPQETFVLEITTNLEARVRFGAVTATAAGLANRIANDGTNWTHIAATYDSDARKLSIYVAEEESSETMAAMITNTAAIPARYGSGPIVQRIGEGFGGLIDEIRIWNIVRSGSEIQGTLGSTLAGTEDGLVAYYRFDDSSSDQRTPTTGVSGLPAWKEGQVEDMTYAFHSDWREGWIHGATIVGSGIHFTNVAADQVRVGYGDIDGDGLPDSWEIQCGLDPYESKDDDGAKGDPDHDGLINMYEYRAGTEPLAVDTDNNGVDDPDEDRDGDGVVNIGEQDLHTMPNVTDTDDDGLSDGEEITGSDNTGTNITALVPKGTSNPIWSLDPMMPRAM